MQQHPVIEDGVYYPDSDGKPMADNDWQWDWTVWIKNALVTTIGDRAYIGSDLFWYPVRGRNDLRIAPDVLVAFGRPAGRRRSYRQWREDDVVPVIVFEVLSQDNTPAEMSEKRRFYEEHGVEEYYELDPIRETIFASRRIDNRPQPTGSAIGRFLERLGIEFRKDKGALVIIDANGEVLGDYHSERRARRIAELRARTEERRADALEAKLADRNEEAELSRKELERLMRLLRARGIDPNATSGQ